MVYEPKERGQEVDHQGRGQVSESTEHVAFEQDIVPGGFGPFDEVFDQSKQEAFGHDMGHQRGRDDDDTCRYPGQCLGQ